jgi:hypothetical protein
MMVLVDIAYDSVPLEWKKDMSGQLEKL